MNILPYQTSTLHSPELPDLLSARLAENVSTAFFTLSQPSEPFRGSIDGRHFKILRVLPAFLGLPTHNSFQPVILGAILHAENGSEIRLRYRLHLFSAVFMSIWFSAFLIGLLGLTLRVIHQHSHAAFLLIPLGMGLFGYLLISALFWPEVKRADALLRDLLHAS